jgi:tRNA(Met) C34 N-acetyltransferase TmcA
MRSPNRKSRSSIPRSAAALKAAFPVWTHPNHTVLVGSPSARQSEELLFKAHGFLRKLEPRASKSQSQVTLPNRSRILALPNAPDNVRGYSADLVILDEAAPPPRSPAHCPRHPSVFSDGE